VTVSDGENKKVIGLTTVPLISEEHKFLGTLALFTDLTPLRDLELRLRETQSLADLGEISGGIAHEFRNSLAAILGYLRLARRTELPPDGERAVANAERESSQLAAAVDALLTYARPMRADLHEVDLNELTRDVIDRLADTWDGIELEVDGDRVVALADAALLSRAVDNLLRNAVDSVRQRGSGGIRVSVRATPEPEIEIADDGMGIDPSEISRLFLPFQSDRPDGYGLGLPLAKKIALLHAGSLQLRGEPGKGAVATIRLPRQSSAARGPAGHEG
jgi:signal transduction histidine kinase